MHTCLISREIGIDMGHRVTHHEGKCKNLHGHRYTIQVTLEGSVASKGSQDGMVLDFGFLKELMMDLIDAPCDHGTCLWVDDHELAHALGPGYGGARKQVLANGYALTQWVWGKLYVLDRVPTAENLAYHWYCRLAEPVVERSHGRARIQSIKVWETPNCSAEYKPGH